MCGRTMGLLRRGRGNSNQGDRAMWDTVQVSREHLSHDMPCARCGHAMHTFLACGDGCECERMSPPACQHDSRLVLR